MLISLRNVNYTSDKLKLKASHAMLVHNSLKKNDVYSHLIWLPKIALGGSNKIIWNKKTFASEVNRITAIFKIGVQINNI